MLRFESEHEQYWDEDDPGGRPFRRDYRNEQEFEFGGTAKQFSVRAIAVPVR